MRRAWSWLALLELLKLLCVWQCSSVYVGGMRTGDSRTSLLSLLWFKVRSYFPKLIMQSHHTAQISQSRHFSQHFHCSLRCAGRGGLQHLHSLLLPASSVSFCCELNLPISTSGQCSKGLWQCYSMEPVGCTVPLFLWGGILPFPELFPGCPNTEWTGCPLPHTG